MSSTRTTSGSTRDNFTSDASTERKATSYQRVAPASTVQKKAAARSPSSTGESSVRTQYRVAEQRTAKPTHEQAPATASESTSAKRMEYRTYNSTETAGTATQTRYHLTRFESRLDRLSVLKRWSDADRAEFRSIIEQLLLDGALVLEADPVEFARALWGEVKALRRLRWEFLSALSEIRSPQAKDFERGLANSLLRSEQAGDRAAAVQALWARSPAEARPVLAAILPQERDPSIRSLITAYLGQA